MSSAHAFKAREVEILRLIAEGRSDREIAARLNLAADTVRWYNKEIYAKLGVRGRTEAAHRAAALGVLDQRSATTDAPVRPLDDGGDAPAPTPAAAAVPWSPIRYVERGGVSIAYQTIGNGPGDLIFFHGFISHLEIGMENAEYASFFADLAQRNRVILFDKRGVGLSDRIKGAPTLEETVGDALAVLDAVGSPRAAVMGTSEGGAASLLFAMQHPSRTRALILIGATAKVSRDGDQPEWAVPRADFEARIESLQKNWGQPWSLERFAPSRQQDGVFEAWWSRMLRGASSPASVRAVMEVARDVDVRALLANVRVPTLVLHRRGDRVVPVGAAHFLAAEIPDARLDELPGVDHVYFVDGAAVRDRILGFLGEPDDGRVTDTRLAVLLSVHTHGSPPTDEQRAILDAMRHRHLRVTPFGWTALFDAPSRALACARRLRDLGRGRIGGLSLHIGACRASDGVAVGVAGEVAQQLATLARSGDVIISDTLRDVLFGSGVTLEPFHPDVASSNASFGWRLAD